jgi:hypothetical protein
VHRVHDDTGTPMAATFEIEVFDGELTLVMYSAGGASIAGGPTRNAQYAPGLEVLLRRLGGLGGILIDAYVDSDRVARLPKQQRHLDLPGINYPIDLAFVADYDDLRRRLTRAQTTVGQSSSARGGNPRKTIRLCLTVPGMPPSARNADALPLMLAQSQDLDVRSRDNDEEPDQASRPSSFGQGFIKDTAAKLAIEKLAMDAARRHYESDRWHVDDVSANHSYDLLCTRDGAQKRIEVKGSTQPIARVLLTPNEVSHALAHFDIVALFVLSDVRLSTVDSRVVATGGFPTVIDPWKLDTTRLSPTGYSYMLD